MRLIGFIVILFTLNTATATEKPKLTILSHAYYDNEVDTQTLTRHLDNVLQPALADHFNLVPDLTNHARLMKRLASNEPSCTFNAIKSPKRAKNMLFSTIPTFMHVQREIFALNETIQDELNPVSVVALLNKKRIFGVIGSASYRELDTVFANQKTNVAYIYGENAFLQLSLLLMNKRIDYIIAYREALEAHLSSEQLARLTSRKIAEYPEFIDGFFTCSKTPEGRKAIQLMDSFMLSERMAKYLKQIHKEGNSEQVLNSMLETYSNKYGILFQND